MPFENPPLWVWAIIAGIMVATDGMQQSGGQRKVKKVKNNNNFTQNCYTYYGARTS
jgi:hypothetical protein